MVKMRLCPRCKKPKLRPAFNVSGWLGPERFECTNCGYTGSFYVEIDSEDYELSEDELNDEGKVEGDSQ